MKKQCTFLVGIFSVFNASAMLTMAAKHSAKSLSCLELYGARAHFSRDKRMQPEAWEMSLLWPLQNKLVAYEEEKALLEASLSSLESISQGHFSDKKIITGLLANPASQEHKVVYAFCLNSNIALHEQPDAAMYNALKNMHLDALKGQNKSIVQVLDEIARMKAIIQGIKEQERNESRVQERD